LYIFGDSLSDDGARAVQLQTEPIDLFFAGRVSNGPIWHEYIRNDLAVAPAASVISQAPNFEGYLAGSSLNGVNFAHAGAVSSSDENPEVPGAVQQAEGFASLVASGAIEAPNDQDVFVIWIGGNDFLELEDAVFEDILDIFQLNSSIIDNIDATVDTLAEVGATNFLIIGQPTVGGAFFGDDISSDSLAGQAVNSLVERYNDRLSDYVSSIDGKDGKTALYVDISSFVDDLEDNPAAYGFDNVTSDILSDGAALDDQSYFSLDGIHPTGAGHAAIANYIAQTAAAADFDLTAFAGNVIPGSERDDILAGSQGPDTITGGPGHDQINGGLGFDTAVYSGNQSSYTLTLGPNSTTVTDRRLNEDGEDTLIDIEFLDFATSDFDLTKFGGAASLTGEEVEDIVELYIAYFNRAPDATGLYYWATAYTNGRSLEEIAARFSASTEAKALYPDGSSNPDLIKAVYNNILGRDPDQGGFEHWLSGLDSGVIPPEIFILRLLAGAQGTDIDYLKNKVDIGTYFTIIKGMSNGQNGKEVMQLFDGTEESVEDAIEATDQFYTAALDPNDGEFLMPLIGVLDDPFAVG
jgi:phospholipase/lecithinase/hemolysin